MPTILDNIIADKWVEVKERQSLCSIASLEKRPLFERQTLSLKDNVAAPSKSGIIAEIKRQSPSKGVMNAAVSVKDISMGYAGAGASGLSILTDGKYFGGHLDDLQTGRRYNNDCPILRKDFVVDEYQLYEAKAHGADVVLLIAAALDVPKCLALAEQASKLNLEVLLEVHSRQEIDSHINEFVDLVGINNRNLKTFDVNIETSFELVEAIPNSFKKISESGITDPHTILKLKKAGFSGFLIGGQFMETQNPVAACQLLTETLNQLSR